jgi:eukaryotic-like serine/threonine-protein kinase
MSAEGANETKSTAVGEPRSPDDARSQASSVASADALAATNQNQCLANRYLFLGLVGTGAMGSVYRARDLWLDETIAVKTLAYGALNALGREVRLARRITHPNVVRVFDLGVEGDVRFITMELVDAGSLLGAATNGPFDPSSVVEIGQQICAGLAAAHAAGIIHRDLKPANVLVSSSGVIKLTDFGIATALADEMTSSAAGTPAYMAPEQREMLSSLGGALKAPVSAIDARTDIYGLGRVLFELLVGSKERPSDSVGDVRDRLAHVPDALAAIVARCLSPRRHDRYASASTVATALAQAVPRTTSVMMASTSSQPRSSRRLFVRSTPGARGEAPSEIADGILHAMSDALRHADGIDVVGAQAPAIDADLYLRVESPIDSRAQDSRVLLEARLVGRRDALVLWQRSNEHAFEDVLVWARDTAHVIAELLDARLRAVTKEPLTDPRALDLYLRARHEHGKRWPGALKNAIDLLEQARTRLPDDPLIISSLAVANALLLMITSDADALDRTEALAERARTLSPERAEGYLATGLAAMNRGEEPRAARDLVRCLELAPSLGEAHAQLGQMIHESGPADRAKHHLAHAVYLDRTLSTFRWTAGRLAYLMRDHEWPQYFEDRPPPKDERQNFFWLNRCRVAIYAEDGRLTPAELAAFNAAPTFDLKPGLTVFVDLSLGKKLPIEALAVADVFAQCDPRLRRRRAFAAILKAELAAAAGYWEAAEEAFVRAANDGSHDAIWAEHCPLALEIRYRSSNPAIAAARAKILARAEELKDALGPLH